MAKKPTLLQLDGAVTAISMEEGAADIDYHYFRESDADDINTPEYLTPTEVSEMFDIFTGSVRNVAPLIIAPGQGELGKIGRNLPKIHPFRNELSSAAVKSHIGLGPPDHLEDSLGIIGLETVTTKVPIYPKYQIRVGFTKRPYFLMSDERIVTQNAQYWEPGAGGTTRSYLYAPEWQRFTSYTRVPTHEYARASFGTLIFKALGGGPVNNAPFTGEVTVNLKNQLLEITWYQVPARYMCDMQGTRSYLTQFENRINHRDWDFNGQIFPKGSLLYLGAEPMSYIPATPKRQSTIAGLALGLSPYLLMNVKLKFLYTSRTGTALPNADSALFTNKNNIAAGHNLFPEYSTGKFYYVTHMGTTEATSNPYYESFPIELLFTDPMLQQPGGPVL